jgi:prepilin-type N-terminal cleavage/methylation domain-containing protein
MEIRTVSPIAQRRAGFTLVELLLVTVLLLLMLSAVIFSFSNLQKNATLDEGASQFEALVRFLRAQSASTGRQIRIAFEEDVGDGLEVPLGNLRVEWEADPLAAPGIFTEVQEAAALVRSITELVRIEFVRALEPDMEALGTNVPVDAETGSAGESSGSVWITFPPVAFYPDGSSDSSEVTLASRDEEDGRRLILKLSGFTGMVRRTMTAAEESFPDAAEATEPAPVESAGESPIPEFDDDKKK